MSQFDKLLQRIRSLDKDMRFDELKTLTSCLCSTQPAFKCYQAAIQAKTSRLYTRKTIITVQI